MLPLMDDLAIVFAAVLGTISVLKAGNTQKAGRQHQSLLLDFLPGK